MDEPRNRNSALPRPSRLPTPKTASSGIPRPAASGLPKPSSARPQASRESLGRSTPVPREPATQTPRVRTSASRDQLRSSVIYGDTRASRLRASASREQLQSSTPRASQAAGKPKPQPSASAPKANRVPSTPQRRTSAIVETHTPPVKADLDAESQPDVSDDALFQRRMSLADQPSVASLSQDPSPLEDDNVVESNALSTETEDHLSAADDRKPRSVRPRPSLSERTMETLASIPPSPAAKKKSSAIFDQRSRSRPRAGSSHSRPGSSYTSDESGRYGSRPSSRLDSSSAYDDSVPLNLRTSFKKPLSTIHGTPNQSTPRRASGVSATTTPKPRKTPSRASLSAALPSPTIPSLPGARSSSPDKRAYDMPPLKAGSKTVAARPSKARGSVNGLFKKPSLPAMNAGASDTGSTRQGSGSSAQSSANSWNGTIASRASTTTSASNDAEPDNASRKSSSALRDQIAKAKAAKRAAAKQASPPKPTVARAEEPMVADDGFDFGIEADDPFNLNKGQDPKKRVLTQRVRAARASGKLNIAALGLKEMPVEVTKMYDLDSIGGNDGSWAESVDLTRLVAADNEFETFDDSIFPDVDPASFQFDDDAQGSMFGGVTSMDLHNNSLVNVPVGWRRLSFLTSLNLSSNQLTNDALETISQITALRDLKLANNKLTGSLHPSLINLVDLEILDLKCNKVSALPDNVSSMQRLRILNLSENSLETLPFSELAKLPLAELVARKNKLSGTLIESPVDSMPHLHTLDLAMNQLKDLVGQGSTIGLPELQTLSLSVNRLRSLPDMSSWTNLLSLSVDENSIAEIPDSFTNLSKLRSADFASNDIRVVPPEVARMDNLSTIRLSGNPLRDRKFASIPTDELKEALMARLEPPPPYQEPTDQATITELMGRVADLDVKGRGRTGGNSSWPDDDDRSDGDDHFATPPTSAHHTPAHSRSNTATALSSQAWLVKSGGVLDRSRTETASLPHAMCSKVAHEHQVRIVHLQHNSLTSVPGSLSCFAATLSTLSLASNQLAGDTYLAEELELPTLKELNLSSNRITSFEPLVCNFRAPLLEKMDVSLNRISSLPLNLKEAFPSLGILLVANNQISELDPQSIKGLKIVDASSNDIGHLNPQLGLLGGRGGLQKLEVMGNRFRVPRWNTLELGTEATLRWLRGRVPVEDMAAWKRENGDDDSDLD